MFETDTASAFHRLREIYGFVETLFTSGDLLRSEFSIASVET
jgi:hypothetical protein